MTRLAGKSWADYSVICFYSPAVTFVADQQKILDLTSVDPRWNRRRGPPSDFSNISPIPDVASEPTGPRDRSRSPPPTPRRVSFDLPKEPTQDDSKRKRDPQEEDENDSPHKSQTLPFEDDPVDIPAGGDSNDSEDLFASAEARFFLSNLDCASPNDLTENVDKFHAHAVAGPWTVGHYFLHGMD